MIIPEVAMLTYNLNKDKLIYTSLYENIKKDIERGEIKSGEKLPSKRQLAEHLKISVISVQNAYTQLLAEGYIYSKERSGYYVCELPKLYHMIESMDEDTDEPPKNNYELSLYKNSVGVNKFPFATWAKIMRKVISDNYDSLFNTTDNMGALELRLAIKEYLYHERGMKVNHNNILIGSGTQYLYSIIIKLLGRENVFGTENPCYQNIPKTYHLENIKTIPVGLDEKGALLDEKTKELINILHISPNHQFPTGIVMPYERRIDILNWAYEKSDRYIIEDDYDSEFRFIDKPIPSIYHMDTFGKTIYMNTFSKTIAPSLRISYLVLPSNLAKKFRDEFNFITNTVPSFEQYTLAKFIKDGYFERYIKKMNKYYKTLRSEIIQIIEESSLNDYITIKEQNAGVHFAMKLKTKKKDMELKKLASDRGLKMIFMSEFSKDNVDTSTVIFSYYDFEYNELSKIIDIIKEIIKS